MSHTLFSARDRWYRERSPAATADCFAAQRLVRSYGTHLNTVGVSDACSNLTGILRDAEYDWLDTRQTRDMPARSPSARVCKQAELEADCLDAALREFASPPKHVGDVRVQQNSALG